MFVLHVHSLVEAQLEIVFKTAYEKGYRLLIS